ncbi:MAG: DUF3800 domain-containing protein [Phenylobacterium sp.]|uniref:DUF3800 domain-containing protein n=1 Tax=Phenylobacterium sp. TaxID=1871053 RepID=UPI002734C9E1|nr:DUF3800 domain-containing protein [Phenylobacterium sp.]MDP3115955.1 DUF3800 domain-containing protein [Phenylobacterium sp.]
MIDVDERRETIIDAHGLENVGHPFTIHYDETNNIRRLRLTPGGLNVREPRCFVLGGVAHDGPAPPMAFETLRDVLSLQKSAVELKLEQLGKGDGLAILDAPRVGAFLAWLQAQDVLLHYQVLDPLYWSIVDIIDSIVTEHGAVQLMMMAPVLKTDLYKVLRFDTASTAAWLESYGYPNVGADGRAAFITDLLQRIDDAEGLLPPFNYQMLKGVIQIARRLDALPFLEDEPSNILIDGFGGFYLERVTLFKDASHVLDIEPTIAAYLDSLPLVSHGQPFKNYRFADSKLEPWVQVADAVAGLLGKVFTFLNDASDDELEEAIAALSHRQRDALERLSNLLNRSVETCAGFAHHIVALDAQHRRQRLLGY